MKTKPARIFNNFVHAVVFGAMFCSLLHFSSLGNLLFRPTDCWDSQDDFLLSVNQFGLFVSAALTFFAQAFWKARGHQGVLSSIAVMFLCFQLFSIAAIYDVIFVRRCYFPETELTGIFRENWKSFLLVSSIRAACGTIFCLPQLIIYKRLLADSSGRLCFRSALDLDDNKR